MECISPDEILTDISLIEDPKLRNGYYMIYLGACNASEIFGKYHLTKSDIVEYEDRVMFKIKCARYQGRVRPILLPKTGLVKEVIEYIKTHETPFLLHPNISTSKTYAMNETKIVFKGRVWAHIDYKKTLKHEKWSKYLKTISKPKNLTNFNFPVKMKRFTLSSLRKLRQRELYTLLGFNRVEYEAFTAHCEDDNDKWLYEIGMIYYDKLSSC